MKSDNPSRIQLKRQSSPVESPFVTDVVFLNEQDGLESEEGTPSTMITMTGECELHSQSELTALMEELRPAVIRAIRRVLGHSPEEEDIAQEVFLRLMIRLRQPLAFPAGPWCLRVAHNLAVDFARRRRFLSTEQASFSVAEGEGLDCIALGVELGEELLQALDHLPDRQREALLASLDCLSDRDDLHARVARRLLISRKAAESLLGRARHNLRVDLERRGAA